MFSVFLLISASIWLLNALSENYTTIIEYPLVYTDYPEDKVFVGEMPGNLDLQINSHGYALLRYKLFRKPVPISFKVSAFNLSRGADSSRAYILTRYLKDQIANQLPAELQLLEIKPDTLHFQFAGRVTKMVKIMPDFIYNIDKQFTIKDKMDFVYTERVDLGDLSRNYSDRVRLNKMADLNYAFSRVNCAIELERFTVLQLTVPIEVLNLPDSIFLQTFPPSIKLSCKVGLSKYESIEGYPFRAQVDYEEIEDGVTALNVSIQNLPLYLLGFEYYPKNVEFLKSKR